VARRSASPQVRSLCASIPLPQGSSPQI
jgi:hypothetical protein